LFQASAFGNLERDEMDLLHMINNTHWWWWHCKIKRNAKFQSGSDVEIVKKSQLCLSIVFDPR
jgi:hypothetical protein